jgi:pimeloyl-ACP methyl ester carboxylesterase
MERDGFASGWVVVGQVRGMRETVYGVKTFYTHAGEGEPLVLIHGSGAGAAGLTNWEPVIAPLAERYHVYVPDLIGAGYTDKPAMQYSYGALVEHLAGFVDALNLGPVGLVGGSVGAYVGIKYALDHPARVRGAALIGSGTLSEMLGLRDAHAEKIPGYDGTRESMRARVAVMINNPAALTDALVDARVAVAAQPGYMAALESLNRYKSEILAGDASEQQLCDLRPRLPRLAVPWCLIWGADDRSAPVETVGRGLRGLFPDVPLYVVEGSGHQVQFDQPAACARVLLEFFASCPSRRR